MSMSIRQVNFSKNESMPRPFKRTALIISQGLMAVLGVIVNVPSFIAGRLIDRFFDKRKARAAKNHRWAQIQALRVRDGGSLTFLSDDLSLADWEEQSGIEEKLTPDPIWLPLARKVYAARNGAVLAIFKAAKDRVFHGFDNSDVYNLNGALCDTLSKRLTALADSSHGWPGEHTAWPTPEDWDKALRFQAAQLLRFNTTEALDAAQTAWYRATSSRNCPPELLEQTKRVMEEVEQADLLAAKNALIWVAENLEYLWD